MKIRVLVSILCACLVFFVFTGCGMKMPQDSGATPSGSADSSTTDDDASYPTAITGIVSSFDNETITINLAELNDGTSSEGAETFTVGSSVYVISGGVRTISPDSSTAVLYESAGYKMGVPGDIAAGHFLAVVLRGDKVITIIDAGPGGIAGSDTESIQPTIEPTDTEEPTASPGVPDSTEPTAYMVITDGLKVRSGPGLEYAVLGVLDKGSTIKGTVSEGWVKYTYDGKTAYSSAEFVTISTAPEGVPDSSEQKTYKTTENLMARSGPGTTYSSLGTLEKGTELTGTVLGGWLKFTYDEKTAYCSAAYLTAG